MKEQETSAGCLTCACFHLTEKMTPQAGCSVSETQEEEHQMQRMMAKRSKIIKELVQTEKDYLNDLELCIREVVQPLRNKQVKATSSSLLPHPNWKHQLQEIKAPQCISSICPSKGRVMGLSPESLGLGWQKAPSHSHLCQQRDTQSPSIWPRKPYSKIGVTGVFFLGFLWNG